MLGHATTRSVQCGRHDRTGPEGARETPVYVACTTCRGRGASGPAVRDGDRSAALSGRIQRNPGEVVGGAGYRRARERGGARCPRASRSRAAGTGCAHAAPGRAPRGVPRALRPLRHREFGCWPPRAAASLLADGLWLVALVWQVIALGGGPSDLSVVATATSLGLVAAVLIGGVAADRLPQAGGAPGRRGGAHGRARRRRGARPRRAACRSGRLAALAFVVGTAGGFYYPAWSAVVPTLLPADELLAANGLEGMLRPLAQQAAGPALAGLLVGRVLPGRRAARRRRRLPGSPCCRCWRCGRCRRSAPDDGADARAVGAPPARRGLRLPVPHRLAVRHARLRDPYVLVVIGPIEVLLPFAVRDRVGAGPAGLSLVLAAYGVGSAVGRAARVVAAAAAPLPDGDAAVLGPGRAAAGRVRPVTLLWVMVAASFAVGVTDAAAMVIWGTLLQRRVPPHLLGRVSSLDFFVSLALLPVSMALAGPVGERVGIPATFVVAAWSPPLLAVVALVAWRLPRDEIAHPLDRDRPVAHVSSVDARPELAPLLRPAPVRARRHRPAVAPRRLRRRPAGHRPAAHPARGVRLLRRSRRRRAVVAPGPRGVRQGRVPPVGAARRVGRRHRPRHPRPTLRPPLRVRPHRLHPDDAHRGRARGGVGGAGDRRPLRAVDDGDHHHRGPGRLRARRPLWFQLYLWRDRSFGKDLVQRAAAAGYDTLMLTVDTPAGRGAAARRPQRPVDPARPLAAHGRRRRAAPALVVRPAHHRAPHVLDPRRPRAPPSR